MHPRCLAVTLILLLAHTVCSRNLPAQQGRRTGRLLQENGPLTLPLNQESSNVIVLFRETAGAGAAQRLVFEVQQALSSDTVAAAAAADSSSSDLQLVGSIGGSSSSSGDGDVAAVASAAAGSSDARGIVIKASPAALQQIKANSLVAHVFADRAVAAQATDITCMEAQGLSQGVSARASSSFKWVGCLTSRSKLVWRASLCSGDRTKLAYSEVRAVSQATGQVIKVKGQPCMLVPSTKKDAASRRSNQQRFGSCGIAPSLAPTLPSTLCSANKQKQQPEQPGTNPNQAVSVPSPSPSSSPSPSPEPSPSPSPSPEPSPSPSPSPEPSPSPSPQPSPEPEVPTSSPSAPDVPIAPESGVMARAPMAEGEIIPAGVARIGAASAAAGVVSSEGLPVADQVVVGVIDSGIDGTHPDLHYLDGKSWVSSSDKFPSDADPGADYQGHGSHVAGTVSGRNNGAGVVGVSPGIPVFSLKVLDGAGRGSLANVLSAVTWAATEGKARGIKVINLSLAAFVDPEDEDYVETVEGVCSVFKQASDAGIVVTVAAGNFGSSIRSYLPAVCPTVVTVTAIDNTTPASWSNFLDAGDSTDAERAHVIAAPGVNIFSTTSFMKDPTGYRTLSGTSMAAPHIAGIAANCLMSGACSGPTGLDSLAVIQAAARSKYAADATWGFNGDALKPANNGKFYGLLAFAKF